MTKLTCDVAVIGASLGGIAATLALLRQGRRVVLTEETDWLGGQATSQGVPPDENRRIEDVSGTRSYLAWRDAVRDYYRRHYPLSEAARRDPRLNPGAGTVSALCHEPQVSARVFEDLLAAAVSLGRLVILRETVPVAAAVVDCRITSLTVRSRQQDYELHAACYLDATELGDLLPLTGTAHVTGSEARSDTGELHAAAVADPLDMQSITWCFAMSRGGKEADRIAKPAAYEHWKRHLSPFWPGPQLSWFYSHPITLKTVEGTIEPRDGTNDLWRYRRILGQEHYDFPVDEITLVNWPQNDYWFGNILGETDAVHEQSRREARELSLCWFYWLQNEAPRPDGGRGYPDLRLRGDVLGTEDGLAKYPYIREARRLIALERVTEADIGYDMRRRALGPDTPVHAVQFPNSVGIGYYRIDLHPSTGGRNYIDIESLPFQIPLGILIPRETRNLLAAAKNVGTTHISNGCYRLHPVEWNIGEAAGYVSDFCLRRQSTPQQLWSDPAAVRELQQTLVAAGIPLEWPEELRAGLR